MSAVRTSDGTALQLPHSSDYGHDAVEHDDGYWTVRHARVDAVVAPPVRRGRTDPRTLLDQGNFEQAYLHPTATETEFAAQPW